MKALTQRSEPQAQSTLEQDSPVTILQHLEAERGKMFTESEYREMRRVVVEELAYGARMRPFTLFTFGVVGVGLLGMLCIGLFTASGNATGDFALAVVSACALAALGYFVWSYHKGVQLDAMRSVDARLSELERLRDLKLISIEEFEHIQAHIVIARQRYGA